LQSEEGRRLLPTRHRADRLRESFHGRLSLELRGERSLKLCAGRGKLAIRAQVTSNARGRKL